MTTRARKAALFVLGALAPFSFSAPAVAQDPEAAKALFDRGYAHMEAQRYAAGCPALQESYRLDPRLGTLFTLGSCESRRGRIATAMKHLGDYLAQVERLPPEQRLRQGERPRLARAELDRLTPRVPELSLSLPPAAPPGTVVKRDGEPLHASELGVPMRVDPGEHGLSIQTPGGPVREQRILLAEGEKKQVTLELDPALPPATAPLAATSLVATPPPPTGDAPAAGRRLALYLTGGVGVAGLALGVVTGVLTIGEKGIADDHCGRAVGSADPTACDATGLEATESGRTLGLVSTVGFGVGLAGLAAASALYWTAPTRPSGASRPAVRAGVLAAGPTGLVLGAAGAF